MIDRTDNRYWQLQNALDTAMRNMIGTKGRGCARSAKPQKQG